MIALYLQILDKSTSASHSKMKWTANEKDTQTK